MKRAAINPIKRSPVFILACLLFFSTCETGPEKIPNGEWKYKLYVNGIEVGTALISNRIENGNYLSLSEYSMKMGDMTTLTRDKITETLDFKPVRLESYSRIENADNVHETNIISVFDGRNVELTYGNKKYNYTVNRDFIIDGNYFMGKLIQGKFRKGLEVSNYVYNPSVELETPIKAITRVVGFENVQINGEEKQLLHIVQSIENISDNIDLFIDSKGILQKSIIHMLNLKIELIMD